MADDVPAIVFQVPAAAAHHTRGRPAAVPATLVAAAAALVSAGALASPALAYVATLAASLVAVARAACPELVDARLARLDAGLRRAARRARADLANDARLLRGMARDSHPVVAAACDRAEERARAAVAYGVRAMRRWAEATWTEHQDAIGSARFFVHLVAAAVNAAYEAASARAPAVLSHLRAVIEETRRKSKPAAAGTVSSSSSSSSGFKLMDMACLAQTAASLVFITDVFVHTNALDRSPFAVWVPCFEALCFTAAKATVSERGSPVSYRGESWRFLWFVMVMAYVADACLLRFTLGLRPLALAFLALCHVKVISVGRRVQRAPEDRGVHGGPGRWRRAATALLSASVVKVAAVGVVVNVQLAALSLVALCVTAVLVLMREENLSDLDGEVERAGFSGNIVVAGAEEEAGGEGRAEQSNTRREEHADEQGRHQEPDHSSSSSSMDDDWDFVEVDPKDVDEG